MHKLIYLCLFVLLACFRGKEKDNSTEAGSDLLKFRLSEINGENVDLTKYKGESVFINVWATWCKPCIREMPTIENAQRKLKDRKVVFLLASNEDPEQIEKFIKRHTYNFHYVRLENMEALKIQALPTTFIFNPAGKLKFSETGYRKWDNPDNLELITKIINDHEK